MDSKLLISELVKNKLLDNETGDKALRDASISRQPVENIIHSNRLADEVEVVKIKSKLLNIPYKEVSIESIGEDILKLIPEEISRTYSVVPLSRDEKMLIVGMVYPDDLSAQNALRYIAKQLGVNLGVYLVTPSIIESVWRLYSPYKNEVNNALKSLNISDKDQKSDAGQKVIKLDEKTALGEEAPIIKIVASTLKEAVAGKASDIHFEPERERMRIRFRVDGTLHEVTSLPLKLHQPIISRIKIMSNLKIDETRIPQDGRFRTILFGKDIDFRVSTFPTPMGEKIALRVLDPTLGLKGLNSLGLESWNQKIIEDALSKPFGLILITGPTGSGKTTTIYSILQKLNSEEVNIVSLEDPVEYFMESINQSNVRPEIGYDFATGLRQILRQDPDVIMVGEIRDRETASLVIHAALTGHVVVSTLHTNDAVGVIPRLIDMGVDAFLVPSALNLMVAQRLIVRNCDSCKTEEEASPELQKIIKSVLDELPAVVKSEVNKKFSEPYKIFKARGCKICNNKGSVGRVAIFEMFKMSGALGRVISGGVSGEKLAEEAKRQGMITLRSDGVIKALEGIVPIEEVLRETTEE